MDKKVCSECEKTLPVEEFELTEAGNRRQRCMPCRKTRERRMAQERNERTMESLEKESVSTFLKAASKGGENVPHISELLERTMTLFGGSGGFAQALVKQFFDATPGSAARTRILETLTKLTVQTSEMGASKKPLELWSDDELEGELNKRLEGIAATWRVIDATQVTAEPELQRIESTQQPEEYDTIPEGSASRDTGGNLPEVDRSDQDVSAERDSGRDASEQG
jgi:hypothetical protein